MRAYDRQRLGSRAKLSLPQRRSCKHYNHRPIRFLQDCFKKKRQLKKIKLDNKKKIREDVCNVRRYAAIYAQNRQDTNTSYSEEFGLSGTFVKGLMCTSKELKAYHSDYAIFVLLNLNIGYLPYTDFTKPERDAALERLLQTRFLKLLCRWLRLRRISHFVQFSLSSKTDSFTTVSFTPTFKSDCDLLLTVLEYLTSERSFSIAKGIRNGKTSEIVHAKNNLLF